MNQSRTIRSVGGGLLLLLFFWPLQTRGGEDLRPQIGFEVLSVTVLTESEALQRSPDYIGANVVVRLRLSNPRSGGFYFYSFANSIIPIGYKVRDTDRGTQWMYGRSGEYEYRSPGLARLTPRLAGAWIALPPYSAVEWEQIDSSGFQGERHAFTVFLKAREQDAPVEVLSSWFNVPSKADKEQGAAFVESNEVQPGRLSESR